MCIPFDSEASNSRLFGKNIAIHSFNNRLRRWLVVELFAVVFIVHVVSDSYEFSSII